MVTIPSRANGSTDDRPDLHHTFDLVSSRHLKGKGLIGFGRV